VLRVRGNAAEVPGTYVPWLAFAAGTSPGDQSIKGARTASGGQQKPKDAHRGSRGRNPRLLLGIDDFDRMFTSG
jgi:hypothetical protein